MGKAVLVSELIMLHIPRKPTHTGFYKQLSVYPLRENPEGSQALGLVTQKFNEVFGVSLNSAALSHREFTFLYSHWAGGHLGLQSHPWTSDYARV